MYPHERSLVRHLADKPFAIIGVNSDDDLEFIREKVKEKSITWRSFWNGDKGPRGPISTKWGIRGWPTTFLIDAKGVIRYQNVRGEALDKAIEELMAEMEHEVKLVGIDHEAEDAKALAAAKQSTEKPAEASKEKPTEEAKPEKKAGAKP